MKQAILWLLILTPCFGYGKTWVCPGNESIRCVGDSFMNTTSYYGLVNTLDRVVKNRTITKIATGGTTSGTACVRVGAVTVTGVSVVGGIIPDNGGSVTFEFPTGYTPNWSSSLYTIYGVASGTYGYIHQWSLEQVFYPLMASGPVTVDTIDWVPIEYGRPGGIQIWGAGRNDTWNGPEDWLTYYKNNVVSYVSQMEKSTKKIMLIGITNNSNEPYGSANYTRIIESNSWLKSTYPDYYVDVRSAWVAGYNPLDSADVAAHALDMPPPSLSADETHPNDAGYALITRAELNFLLDHHYIEGCAIDF